MQWESPPDNWLYFGVIFSFRMIMKNPLMTWRKRRPNWSAFRKPFGDMRFWKSLIDFLGLDPVSFEEIYPWILIKTKIWETPSKIAKQEATAPKCRLNASPPLWYQCTHSKSSQQGPHTTQTLKTWHKKCDCGVVTSQKRRVFPWIFSLDWIGKNRPEIKFLKMIWTGLHICKAWLIFELTHPRYKTVPKESL